MSKEVDRNKVFQTTRVRTALKNDVSWIQKSDQKKEEPDNARMENVVATKPPPVRQNSYVLSTAKKFESVDPPLSPTQFTPSDGDSANQANGEVIPPQKDAQPEGSTVETTDDIKPQAPTEELLQNGEAQPEKSVPNTPAENKDEHADTAVSQSNVEHNEGSAEVSADVHVEECVQNGGAQPVSSTKTSPEAESPVEPAEQPVSNTTTENKGENADTATDHSNVEHNEAKVSADAHVEDPVAEASAVTDAAEGTAEVPAALAVEPKPQEEPSTKNESAGVETTVKPAEGSPPEQAAEETVKAVAEVVVESSPEKSEVINTTPGEEAALQDDVEAVPGLAAEPAAQSPTQPAAGATTGGSCETSPPEQAAGETVDAVVAVAVESLPETPAVTAAAGEEAAHKDNMEADPGVVAESVAASPTQPAAEAATVESCETGLPEQAAGETVGVVAQVAVESSPETPAAAAGEEAAVQDRVDIVAGIASELPTQPAAEAAVKSVECKVESAASAEPVLKSTAEEAVESETQPVDNAVVEQNVEPTPESTADRVVEPNAEDAVKPAAAPDAEAAQDEVSHRAIELTDALDVEPPTAEAAPEPLKDPNQSHTQDMKRSDDANISEVIQKPVDEPQSPPTQTVTRDDKAVCSFCDTIIDGRIRITFSEPLVKCHPECLKCGVCATAMGDLLTPMFLHNQVIQCGGCFATAIKT